MCLLMFFGCQRTPRMRSSPKTMRAPTDEQMERVAIYSAFLARQVPMTKWPWSGRRMEGLLIRRPLSYRGYELSLVQKYVFPNKQFLVQAGLGRVNRSYKLADDTLKNFYVEGARIDDLFTSDQFTGPFVALDDSDDLNSRFKMSPCHRPEMCGLKLIEHELPISGGLWGFSHIGLSRDHRQALVYYNNGFWGETGVALLEKRDTGWSIVASAPLSVS
jgi:hypothetical protein